MKVAYPNSSTVWHSPYVLIDSDTPIDAVRVTSIRRSEDGAFQPLPTTGEWHKLQKLKEGGYVTGSVLSALRDPSLSQPSWVAFERHVARYCEEARKRGRTCIRVLRKQDFDTIRIGVGDYRIALEALRGERTERLPEFSLRVRPVFEDTFADEAILRKYVSSGKWEAIGALSAMGDSSGETWFAQRDQLPAFNEVELRLRRSSDSFHGRIKASANVYLETLAQDFSCGVMLVTGRALGDVGNFPVGFAAFLNPDNTLTVQSRKEDGRWITLVDKQSCPAAVSGWNLLEVFFQAGNELLVAVNETWSYGRYITFPDLGEWRAEALSAAALYRSTSSLASVRYEKVALSYHGHRVRDYAGWLTGEGKSFLRSLDDSSGLRRRATSVRSVKQRASIACICTEHTGGKLLHFELSLPKRSQSAQVKAPKPLPSPVQHKPLSNDLLQLPSVADRAPRCVAILEEVDPLDNSYDPKRDALNAEAKELYDVANVDYRKDKEREFPFIRIESGFRSVRRQAELYEDYIRSTYEGGSANAANKPGKSKHNYGVAIDIVRGNDEGRLTAALSKAKWEKTVEDEGWHFEATGIPGWKAVEKAVSAVRPISEKYGQQIVRVYENRKRIREKYPSLEVDRERLVREGDRLKAEERRLQIVRSQLEASRDALEKRKLANENEGRSIERLRLEIESMRYTLCPAGQPFEMCTHEDLKRQWLAAKNAKVQDYTSRSSRYKASVAAYNRDVSMYERDRQRFLTDLTKFNRDQQVLARELAEFQKKADNVKKYQSAIDAARVKAEALLTEIEAAIAR